MVQRDSSTAPHGVGRRDRGDRPETDRFRQGPVRMCVGCRKRGGIDELVRLVAREGDRPPILVDHSRTMPGRGAWLHPRADCVSAAVRRKAFATALRTPGLIVDQSDLTEVLDADAGAGTDENGPQGPEQVAEDMSTP